MVKEFEARDNILRGKRRYWETKMSFIYDSITCVGHTQDEQPKVLRHCMHTPEVSKSF